MPKQTRSVFGWVMSESNFELYKYNPLDNSDSVILPAEDVINAEDQADEAEMMDLS